MTPSSMMTDASTASQSGASSRLKSPQCCCAAWAATPTAAVGKTTRTTTVFSTTSPILFSQRVDFGCVSSRRGASISQIAMMAKTPKKTPSLIDASCVLKKLSMNLTVIIRVCMDFPEFGELFQCLGNHLDTRTAARAMFT